MIADVADFLGGEPGVDRHHHRTGKRHPEVATSISGMFGHRYATRSPRSMPEARRAFARRVAAAPNSLSVNRRSPYAIAVLSANTSSERSRNASGVSAVYEVG